MGERELRGFPLASSAVIGVFVFVLVFSSAMRPILWSSTLLNVQRRACKCYGEGQTRLISFNIFKRDGGKDNEPPNEDEAVTTKVDESALSATAVPASRRVSVWGHLTPEQIMRIRNKSRLPRDVVCELKGIPQHGTRFYRLSQYKRDFVRKYFAMYGEASGVKPGVCWPSKQELEFRQKFEETFIPPLEKILEEKKKLKEKEEAEEKAYRAEIMKNLKKLPEAKAEFFRKIKEKEKLKEEEKAKREQLVQEVREFLGYDVAQGDTRFAEALAKMEEQKKEEKKVSRRQEKKARIMAHLSAMAEEQIKKAEASSGAPPKEEDATKEASTQPQPDQEVEVKDAPKVKKEKKKKASKEAKPDDPSGTVDGGGDGEKKEASSQPEDQSKEASKAKKEKKKKAKPVESVDTESNKEEEK